MYGSKGKWLVYSGIMVRTKASAAGGARAVLGMSVRVCAVGVCEAETGSLVLVCHVICDIVGRCSVSVAGHLEVFVKSR